jgi:4-diphosphocytidyl-2-C-methyl-D-erythritol kinase
LGVLVLALDHGLSTAQVYDAADALGSPRAPEELDAYAAKLLQNDLLHSDLLQNDLQAAALSLCPEIEASLIELSEVGATSAFVSGSGPTAVGLFDGPDGAARAQASADALSARRPPAVAAVSVGASFSHARPLATSQ